MGGSLPNGPNNHRYRETHDIAGTRHRCRNNRPGNHRPTVEECSGHWHIETHRFRCSRFGFRLLKSPPIARRLRLPSDLSFYLKINEKE